MQQQLPNHYHRLAPFTQFFETGVPALMYHKLGPRPSGVRLKGLYTSTQRFSTQMDEFKVAGFSTAPIGELFKSTANPDRRFAVTFDDGFCNVFKHGLEPMARHNFHAIQYLVPNFIGKTNEWDLRDGEAPEPLMDPAQVRDWLAAGHEIGSHTLSHPRLSRLTLRDAREEIFASKKSLEDTFGVPIDHFCYPYGDYNKPVCELVREAGYKTACITEFGLNTSSSNRLAFYRIAVRYPSRSFKVLKARLFS